MEGFGFVHNFILSRFGNTDIPRFIALRRYCLLLQTEVLWQLCIEQVYYLNSMCSLRDSVSHFRNSAIFQAFLLLLLYIVACFPYAVSVEAIETSKGTQQQKNECLLVVAG
jgi:hypothetical protein